jgi:hypothetical protein
MCNLQNFYEVILWVPSCTGFFGPYTICFVVGYICTLTPPYTLCHVASEMTNSNFSKKSKIFQKIQKFPKNSKNFQKSQNLPKEPKFAKICQKSLILANFGFFGHIFFFWLFWKILDFM